MVEIGDQYATSWTLSEGGITGVGDAGMLAGTVDASTVVAARAGRRRANVGLRSRILTGGGRVRCSQERWPLLPEEGPKIGSSSSDWRMVYSHIFNAMEVDRNCSNPRKRWQE